MSERFVRGWKISPKKLAALVGKKGTTSSAIVKHRANARVRTDVFMTLGDGEAKEGKARATRALDDILGGPLRKEARYDYARVLELLLNAEAQPMKGEILLQLTYAAPNDTHGRWNPMLRALRLPKLTKLWGASTFAFPLTKAKPIDWPTWTLLEGPTLRAIDAELATVTQARVAALDAKLLVDRDRDWLDDCRTELFEGLARLKQWTKSALTPQGSALVLSMDGDQ